MSRNAPDLIVTAPNGIAWKRCPSGTSSGPEFLAALAMLTDGGGRIAREWNWWQEGRRAMEDERIREVVRQWDHAEPPPGGYLTAERLQARLDASQAVREQARQLRAARYDNDLAAAQCPGHQRVHASRPGQARHCGTAGPGTRVPGRQ